MTYAFGKKLAYLATPPVCTSAPQGPTSIPSPAPWLTGWLEILGTTGTAGPIDVEQVVTLNAQTPPLQGWRWDGQAGGFGLIVFVFRLGGTSGWHWNVTATQAGLTQWSGVATGWHPRSVDPFDSGLLVPTVQFGSGVASARIMS